MKELTEMTIEELVEQAQEWGMGWGRDEFVDDADMDAILAEARRRDSLPRWEPERNGVIRCTGDYGDVVEVEMMDSILHLWTVPPHEGRWAMLPDDVRLCRLSVPPQSP